MEMNPIDCVLSCPSLPSLPGVALRLLELTRDPNVRLDAIAGAVENDPALASRVLRTVNSSYYGLARPCPTIGRALGFLGLTTVKSLVLGFSLVDSARRVRAGTTFDLTAYWRRAIYGASAARLFASGSGACEPEQAFLGALIRDIGILAACTALKKSYSEVVAAAGDDHDRLADLERSTLGFDHAQVGGLLAERWRLPPQFVECIRHHHTPDEADPEHRRLVRAVSLGATAAGILAVASRGEKLGDLVERAGLWLEWDSGQVETVLKQTAERAAEVSSLLDVKTGEAPDVTAILAEANERLAEHQVEVQREACALKQANAHLERRTITDGLTGAFNRGHFDAEFSRVFTAAVTAGAAVALLFLDIDRFKTVNDTRGHAAGDEVLVEITRRLCEVVACRGTVCRYGGDEFAVILPGVGSRAALRLAEQLRAAAQKPAIDLRRVAGPGATLAVTISIGVAAVDADTRARFPDPDSLIRASDVALYASKRHGRNRVTLHSDQTLDPAAEPAANPAADEAGAPGPDLSGLVPEVAAAGVPTRARCVLLVEDDAMAARFFTLLCARTGVSVATAISARAALASLMDGRVGGAGLPDLIVCDVGLPDMPGWEFIKRVRALPALGAIPVVALGGSSDPADRAWCLEAGAELYIRKADLCAQMSCWLEALAKLWGGQARAA